MGKLFLKNIKATEKEKKKKEFIHTFVGTNSSASKAKEVRVTIEAESGTHSGTNPEKCNSPELLCPQQN